MEVLPARIALDIGEVRIGVAYCPADSTLVIPVKTVRRQADGSEIKQILSLIEKYAAREVVIGLPLLLSGKEGSAARMARSYAYRLRRRLPQLHIRLVDERLTSVQAHRQLSQAGHENREHRPMVDQLAAVGILETTVAAVCAGASIGELL